VTSCYQGPVHSFRCAELELPGERYVSFLHLLQEHGDDPAKAFAHLHPFCIGHLELQELMLHLLDAESAMSLGPAVFRQFRVKETSAKLMRKIKKCYESQVKQRLH